MRNITAYFTSRVVDQKKKNVFKLTSVQNLFLSASQNPLSADILILKEPRNPQMALIEGRTGGERRRAVRDESSRKWISKGKFLIYFLPRRSAGIASGGNDKAERKLRISSSSVLQERRMLALVVADTFVNHVLCKCGSPKTSIQG